VIYIVFEDMNTLKMRIPAAIFTVNVNEITMFDILDTLQKSEDLRGRDFGTIKLEPSNGSLLSVSIMKPMSPFLILPVRIFLRRLRMRSLISRGLTSLLETYNLHFLESVFNS
jgi:hypothetical protein